MAHKPTKYQENIVNEVLKGTQNIMIIANAGCAKSTTCIGQILPILPKEEKVYYGCFGSRIQVDAAEQIAKTKGISCDLTCATFHSLGSRALRKAWGNLRLNNFREQNIAEKIGNFSRDIHRHTIKGIGETAQKSKDLHPFATREELEAIAERFDYFTPAVEKEGTSFDEFINWVELVLSASKKKDGTMSFADMIWVPLVLGFQKPEFDRIIVDECQDLNLSQILFARQALKVGGKGIFVGDPFQCIFVFRGADASMMKKLQDELEGVVVLPLPETFRCGKAIVNLCQDIVPSFIAHESNQEGLVNEMELEDLVGAVRPGDAILSRKNAPLTGICLKLWANEIKAHIEGKDIGKNMVNLCDQLSKKRPMKVGPFLELLDAFASKEEERLKNRRGGEQMIADTWDKVECLEVLSEGLSTVDELKTRILGLFQDGEKVGRKGKVILSSVHKAKGLEFDRVFGLAFTLMDHSQEEHNLRYVMFSRAKAELHLVHKGE